MRLDSLVRLIESADWMSFREIAMQAISARGYRHVELSDGWRDGGRDLRVFQLGPRPLPIAIQVSVEKDWKAKILEDARKIVANLKISDLIFVSSRRIADAEFQIAVDEALIDSGVRLSKMDSQAIASMALREGFTNDILKILHIPVAAHTVFLSPKERLREEVAYAFSFFGNESEEFRRSVIEQAIISALSARAVAPTRPELMAEASDAIGLSAAQSALVESALERMLQRKQLSAPEGVYHLDESVRKAQESMRAVHAEDWRRLRHDVETCLIHRTRAQGLDSSLIDEVMDNLGALLLATGSITGTALEHLNPHYMIQRRLREKLRSLSATLDACGIPEGTERNETLEALTTIATSSSLGRHLVAGEVFIAFTSLRTPELVRALGARESLTVLLDSSVAIPLLVNLLYFASKRGQALAVQQAYDQLRAHEIRLVLPQDYLEETATHLIDAYRRYSGVIEADDDLRASKNAFVSQYITLRREGRLADVGFEDFLTGLGLDTRLLKGDYNRARDVIMKHLSGHFDRYNIQAIRLGRPSRDSERLAQEAVAFAEHEQQLSRPRIVIDHDIRTMAFLHDQEAKADITYILCTWDNLHFFAREFDRGATKSWHVLDPALLRDILSLALPGAARDPLLSPLVVAMEMSDADAARGARVWDILASIEKEGLHDAALIDSARQFKRQFVTRTAGDIEMAAVRVAWTQWKEQHGQASGATITAPQPIARKD